MFLCAVQLINIESYYRIYSSTELSAHQYMGKEREFVEIDSEKH